ncbi:vomeromodulin-like [Gracilinanus agilis]|uniref:vomeromodulin-like n=1 Tax=Gracilinanus agilis TaxID=191870 RepID=UPI001CFCD47E|nr:vomeromodulin-like [Gracilinanus agilis]
MAPLLAKLPPETQSLLMSPEVTKLATKLPDLLQSSPLSDLSRSWSRSPPKKSLQRNYFGTPDRLKKKVHKDLPETKNQSCEASAWIFHSKKEIDDHMNDAMKKKTEDIIRCAKMELAGIAGELLAGLLSGGLVSDLPISTDVLSKLTSGSLSGALPNLPISDIPGLSNGGVNSLLGESGSLVDSLPKMPLENSKNSEESQGTDKSEDEPKLGLDGVLSGKPEILPLTRNQEGLIVIKEVIVKDLVTKMEGGNMIVNSNATVIMGGSNGVEGLVGEILQFKMDCEVTCLLSLIQEKTCPSFGMKDKKINPKAVKLEIIDNPIVSMLQEENCPISFKLPESKNGTESEEDFFSYQMKDANFTEKGFQVSYCVKFNDKGKAIDVSDGQMPPNPENANTSIGMSSAMTKKLITRLGREMSKKEPINGTEILIKKLSYKFSEDNLQLSFDSDMKKDGAKIATGHMSMLFSIICEIINDHIKGSVNLISFDSKTEPSDNEVANNIMKRMPEEVTKQINGMLNMLLVNLEE